MGIYRKLMVAYDGSDCSQNALKHAVALAKRTDDGCTVDAVSVTMLPEEYGIDALGAGAIMNENVDAAHEAVGIAEALGMKIASRTLQGHVFDSIVEEARTGGFDLIVMGRRGMTRLERVLMGSVTARVVGHTNKDVLIVPVEAEINWKRIMLSTDGSKYSEAATERALKIAQAFGASVHAVSVVEVSDEYYSEAAASIEPLIERARMNVAGIKGQADAMGVACTTNVRVGEAHRAIVDAANEEKVDLIVMGSHGRKGLTKFLMGSVTEKVIGLAHRAILVARV